MKNDGFSAENTEKTEFSKSASKKQCSSLLVEKRNPEICSEDRVLSALTTNI